MNEITDRLHSNSDSKLRSAMNSYDDSSERILNPKDQARLKKLESQIFDAILYVTQNNFVISPKSSTGELGGKVANGNSNVNGKKNDNDNDNGCINDNDTNNDYDGDNNDGDYGDDYYSGNGNNGVSYIHSQKNAVVTKQTSLKMRKSKKNQVR